MELLCPQPAYSGMNEPQFHPRQWLRLWRSQRPSVEWAPPGIPVILEAGSAPSIVPADDPDRLPGHGRYGEAY